MCNWYGYILVVISAVFFGASSIVCKFTYATGLAPVPVLLMQGVLSCAISWGWVLVTNQAAGISRSLLLPMLAQGIIGSFLTSLLFFIALDEMGASLTTLLVFSYPAFVLVYNAIFVGRNVTPVEKIVLVMAFLGIVFCVDLPQLGLSHMSTKGILLALGAAITYAFMNINGERLLAEVALPVVTAWTQTLSLMMLVAIYQPVWMLDVSLSWQQLGLLATGGGTLLIPIMIYMAGLKRIGAGIASILSTAEIPITLFLAWLLLGETLSLLQVAGGMLIMLSVMVLYYYRME
ncbi:MAG: protein of unknown function transrane [Firmicutes bacterium]|nr:protein of unknown function transrane [Bacillota bacterium]